MILDEAIDFLDRNLSSMPVVKKIVINPCFSGLLLENGDMGMSMNVRSGTGYDDAALNDRFRELIGKDGMTAALALKALQDPVAGSIRLALINALSRPFMTDDYLRQRGCLVQSGGSGYSGRSITDKDTVAIVGYGGNVRGISRIAQKVYVTELVPEMFRSTLITRGGVEKGPFCAELVHASDASSVFEKADIVMLTGCTLVTDTMEAVLDQIREKHVVVYGCSAGFFPAPLFLRGVNVISTRRVTDSETMMDLLVNCAGMVERFFPSASEEVMITENNSEAYGSQSGSES